MEEFAYEDSPLPIGEGQTISQPYIVARMVEALELEPGGRVLDVGTGSGYAAAILSRIAAEVYSIERVEELAARAEKRLAKLGCDNVHVTVGDGSRGWAEHAPYDAIVVAAVDRFVRHAPAAAISEKFFSRFPRWMWANESVSAF